MIMYPAHFPVVYMPLHAHDHEMILSESTVVAVSWSAVLLVSRHQNG